MRWLKAFLKDKILEILIIVLGIQLVQGAITIYLGNRPIYIVLLAVGIILLVILFMTVKEFIQSKRISQGKFVPEGQTRKGVIFTLGLGSHKDDGVVINVMKRYAPLYCGFLGTKETDRANITSQIIEKMNLKPEQYSSKTVDPTKVLEIKQDLSHIFSWMLNQGLKPEDVTLDLTSGTAIMSVGAFMAAEELNLEVQYIYSDTDENNRIIQGTQRPFMIRPLKK
jgi:hypothetical protein